MAKRKRQDAINGEEKKTLESQTRKKSKHMANSSTANPPPSTGPITVQIVAGSYDRVLHGITATISGYRKSASFADTFLFTAHTSAIRCLALSAPSAPRAGQSQKIMLATGSTDERINVYNLSAHPPPRSAARELLSSIAPRPVAESAGNRELGTLLHHAAAVTRLSFPTRSKLLSSAEDSAIAVTRTRDWSLLSTIRAPVPMSKGRPSGDTAPLGGAPSGVNDFAVHPSMKLMISVGKGEKCMRLWNLVTGKRAGVLNFGKDVLVAAGESKHASGEGRRVVWGSCDGEDEYAVGFDRNIVVFGMDSTPRCRLLQDARTKIHEFQYLRIDDEADRSVVAVATEDGRILFFSTRTEDLQGDEQSEKSTGATKGDEESQNKKTSKTIPSAKLVAQLGTTGSGGSGRIKDFAILPFSAGQGGGSGGPSWLIAAGSSDGIIKLWMMVAADLKLGGNAKGGKQIGQLLGTYSTQNRITCVDAFVMIPRPEGVADSEDDFEGFEDEKDDGGEDSDNE